MCLDGERLEEPLAQASDLDWKLVESRGYIDSRFLMAIFFDALENIAV